MNEKKIQAEHGIKSREHISAEITKTSEIIRKAADVIKNIEGAIGAEENQENATRIQDFKSSAITIRKEISDAMVRIRVLREKASPTPRDALGKELDAAEAMLAKLSDAERIAENYVAFADGTAKVERLRKDVDYIDELFLKLQEVYDRTTIADISLASASEKLDEIAEKIATALAQVKTLGDELETRLGGLISSKRIELNGLIGKVLNLILKRDNQTKVAAGKVLKVVESVKELDVMVKSIEVRNIKAAADVSEAAGILIDDLKTTEQQVLREAISVPVLLRLIRWRRNLTRQTQDAKAAMMEEI
jgi:hypothetical protein